MLGFSKGQCHFVNCVEIHFPKTASRKSEYVGCTDALKMSFGVWQYVLEKELVNSFYFLRFGTRNNQTCLFVILLQRHQMRILLVFLCTACVNSHYHYKHINIKQLKKRPIFFITVKTRHKQDTR